jgi:hypothetical protein
LFEGIQDGEPDHAACLDQAHPQLLRMLRSARLQAEQSLVSYVAYILKNEADALPPNESSSHTAAGRDVERKGGSHE